MRYERSIDIDAPAGAVWAVLRDVENWPSWTPTISSVDLDGSPLTSGAVATVKQPGIAAARYTVGRYDADRGFRWDAHARGMASSADHVVTALDAGMSRVTLSFEMSGPLGTLVGALGGRRIRGMVDTEAESLKREVESKPHRVGR